MKIQIKSDLHLEHVLQAHKNLETGGSHIERLLTPHPEADVLVLAGDIFESSTSLDILKYELENIAIPVILVLGNHEYYHNYIDSYSGFVKFNLRKLPHVHYLENEWVRINDVVFLGSTLWTDIPVMEQNAIRFSMADFDLIQGMTIDKWDNEHRKAVGYLTYMLRRNIAPKQVVVTHFGPSYKSCHPCYQNSGMNAGFYSNLDDLVATPSVKLWIHGHTHKSCDYKIDDTRVVCNPYGYEGYQLNKEYNNDLLIEV